MGLVDTVKGIGSGASDILFGSGDQTSTTVVSPLDYKYIQEQRDRQEKLWPQLQQLAQETGQQADQAYAAALSSLGLGADAAKILAAGPVEAEKLYPGINQKLSQLSADLGKLYNQNSSIALQARTGELGKAYSGVIDTIGGMAQRSGQKYDQLASDVNSFGLDPKALDFLSTLKDERVNALKSDMQRLLGNTVSDLGNRGVLSSSTAEGAIGKVGESLAPALAQINADYANQRLTLPQQLAALQAQLTGQGNADVLSLLTNRYNLGKDYGGTMGAAYDANTAGAQSNADYIARLMGQQYNLAGYLDQQKMAGAGQIYSGQPGYATTISNLSSANIQNTLDPYFKLWNTTAPAGGTVGSNTTGTTPTTGIIPAVAGIAGAAVGAAVANNKNNTTTPGSTTPGTGTTSGK